MSYVKQIGKFSINMFMCTPQFHKIRKNKIPPTIITGQCNITAEPSADTDKTKNIFPTQFKGWRKP